MELWISGTFCGEIFLAWKSYTLACNVTLLAQNSPKPAKLATLTLLRKSWVYISVSFHARKAPAQKPPKKQVTWVLHHKQTAVPDILLIHISAWASNWRDLSTSNVPGVPPSSQPMYQSTWGAQTFRPIKPSHSVPTAARFARQQSELPTSDIIHSSSDCIAYTSSIDNFHTLL